MRHLAFAVLVAGASSLAHADDSVIVDRPLTDTTYSPPQCVDDTDVVGYRRCPSYGVWGENLLAPYVFVDLGVNSWHFTTPGGDESPSTARSVSSVSSSSASSATSAARTKSRMLTYDERVGVGMRYGLYVAFDFELGAFASQPSTSSGLLALVSAGIEHRLGPITLGGEVTGGVLAYSPANSTTLDSQRVLEGRARADVWITPWLTLSGVVGTSLIDQGWMAGGALGFHTHAYGRR
jgi:hypothetical protein